MEAPLKSGAFLGCAFYIIVGHNPKSGRNYAKLKLILVEEKR